MSLISFTEKLQRKDQMALELVTGRNAEGDDHYALLLLPADRVEGLRQRLQRQAVTLEDHGEVLARGPGHIPPEGLVEDLLALMVSK